MLSTLVCRGLAAWLAACSTLAAFPARADEETLRVGMDTRSPPWSNGTRVGHYHDPAVAETLSALGGASFKAFDDPGALFDALKQPTSVPPSSIRPTWTGG